MSNDATTTIGRLPRRGAHASTLADRSGLRLAATLQFSGVLLSLLAGIFHADQAPPNDHHAAFAAYAASAPWTAVHLGQFIGMTVLIAGLLVLFVALKVHAAPLVWVARGGAVSAGVALALYGVLQAVDGVALKQAVDAWARAPEAEQAARFASAEAIRWLEWGVRSYHSFMLGVALILFAIVIVGTAWIARPIGYLMGLSGVAYLVQGWIIGAVGFADTNTIPTLLGIVLTLAWSSWLLISVWRRPVGGG